MLLGSSFAFLLSLWVRGAPLGPFWAPLDIIGLPWLAFGRLWEAIGVPLGLHLFPLGVHWGASRRSFGCLWA